MFGQRGVAAAPNLSAATKMFGQQPKCLGSICAWSIRISDKGPALRFQPELPQRPTTNCA